MGAMELSRSNDKARLLEDPKKCFLQEWKEQSGGMHALGHDMQACTIGSDGLLSSEYGQAVLYWMTCGAGDGL